MSIYFGFIYVFACRYGVFFAGSHGYVSEWVSKLLKNQYVSHPFRSVVGPDKAHWMYSCLVLPRLVAVYDLVVDAQVVVVAFGVDLSVVDGFFYRAAGFVAVCAVGKVAVMEYIPHFGKEMRQLGRLEIYHTEFFDAWGVDKKGGEGVVDDGKDLSKSGGVLAFHTPFADFAYAEVESGVDGVEHGRLAYP